MFLGSAKAATAGVCQNKKLCDRSASTVLQLFNKFKAYGHIDFIFDDARLAISTDGAVQYIDIDSGDHFIWIEKSKAAGAKYAFVEKGTDLGGAKLKFYAFPVAGLSSGQIDE